MLAPLWHQRHLGSVVLHNEDADMPLQPAIEVMLNQLEPSEVPVHKQYGYAGILPPAKVACVAAAAAAIPEYGDLWIRVSVLLPPLESLSVGALSLLHSALSDVHAAPVKAPALSTAATSACTSTSKSAAPADEGLVSASTVATSPAPSAAATASEKAHAWDEDMEIEEKLGALHLTGAGVSGAGTSLGAAPLASTGIAAPPGGGVDAEFCFSVRHSGSEFAQLGPPVPAAWAPTAGEATFVPTRAHGGAGVGVHVAAAKIGGGIGAMMDGRDRAVDGAAIDGIASIDDMRHWPVVEADVLLVPGAPAWCVPIGGLVRDHRATALENQRMETAKLPILVPVRHVNREDYEGEEANDDEENYGDEREKEGDEYE